MAQDDNGSEPNQSAQATQEHKPHEGSSPTFELVIASLDRQYSVDEPSPDAEPMYAMARVGRRPLAFKLNDDTTPFWMSMDVRLIKRWVEALDSGLDPNDPEDRNTVIGTVGVSIVDQLGWTDGLVDEVDHSDGAPPMAFEMIPASEHARRLFVMTLGA